MTPACLTFGKRAIRPGDVRGKHVLEVGAFAVNGSLQKYVRHARPAELVAIDIQPGPTVTRVLDAADLWVAYGEDYFDLVYTTEMFEHVEDWRTVARNLMAVLKPGGLLVLTTRAPGYPRHDFPSDYWRYSADDLQTIFGTLQIERLIEDFEDGGTFIKARRLPGPIIEAPADFRPHEVD